MNYPELFPASPGAQSQEITVSTFSIQPVHIRLHFPIGSKKTIAIVHRIEKNVFFDPIGELNRI